MVLMANMQIERRRVGDCCHNHPLDRGLLMESTPPSKFYSNNSFPLVLQPCSFSSGGGSGGGLGYIEHTVSKFDTLVGVAIKYGVEVSDIKRMNGLTTDQQMFALRSLQIPLPGRHPPSPIMLNGLTNSETTPVSEKKSDIFNSIKSLKLSSSSQRNVSPSMKTLRGYYGHNTNDQKSVTKSLEMAVYRGESGAKSSEASNRRSRSLVNGLSGKSETSVTNEKDDGFDQLVRRRKSEPDLNNHSPETVVKSSSAPSFEDLSNNNNNGTSSSIWATSMLNLTADFQALSTAAIAIPMFDGRKNKAALD